MILFSKSSKIDKSSIIFPNTECLPSTQEQSVKVKKNYDPILPSVAYIDNNPLSSCLNRDGSAYYKD